MAEKVSVSLRLEKPLVERIDALAFKLSKPGKIVTRTEAIVSAIETWLPIAEKEASKK